MDYKSIITKLYFILIYADGHVNEHELASGTQIAKTEAISEEEFRVQIEFLKSKDKSVLLSECIQGLKKLDRKKQIRCIAWLCLVANGDGFMDKTEWQLIYRIYHKELNLPLEEIFKVQKELSRLPREKALLVATIKAIA
jgi:uncharacterized tellurite resistance protein B-like protein